MNRVILAVWIVLLTLSAYGLFAIKYKVYNMRRDVAEVQRQLAADQDEIHVLKAEWTYLTQPERLRVLAEKHLGLQPISVAQIQPLEYQGIMVASSDGSTRMASNDIDDQDSEAVASATGGVSAAVHPIMKPSSASTKVR